MYSILVFLFTCLTQLIVCPGLITEESVVTPLMEFNTSAVESELDLASEASKKSRTGVNTNSTKNSASKVIPNGWSVHTDPDSGDLYYFQSASGKTQWEFPGEKNVEAKIEDLLDNINDAETEVALDNEEAAVLEDTAAELESLSKVEESTNVEDIEAIAEELSKLENVEVDITAIKEEKQLEHETLKDVLSDNATVNDKKQMEIDNEINAANTDLRNILKKKKNPDSSKEANSGNTAEQADSLHSKDNNVETGNVTLDMASIQAEIIANALKEKEQKTLDDARKVAEAAALAATSKAKSLRATAKVKLLEEENLKKAVEQAKIQQQHINKHSSKVFAMMEESKSKIEQYRLRVMKMKEMHQGLLSSMNLESSNNPKDLLKLQADNVPKLTLEAVQEYRNSAPGTFTFLKEHELASRSFKLSGNLPQLHIDDDTDFHLPSSYSKSIPYAVSTKLLTILEKCTTQNTSDGVSIKSNCPSALAAGDAGKRMIMAPSYVGNDYLKRTPEIITTPGEAIPLRDHWPTVFHGSTKTEDVALGSCPYALHRFIMVLSGEIDMRIADDKEKVYLYPSWARKSAKLKISSMPRYEIDLFNPDFKRHPLSSWVTATALKASAGEIIFIPQSSVSSWKYTKEGTILLEFCICDASNINKVKAALSLESLIDKRALQLLHGLDPKLNTESKLNANNIKNGSDNQSEYKWLAGDGKQKDGQPEDEQDENSEIFKLDTRMWKPIPALVEFTKIHEISGDRIAAQEARQGHEKGHSRLKVWQSNVQWNAMLRKLVMPSPHPFVMEASTNWVRLRWSTVLQSTNDLSIIQGYRIGWKLVAPTASKDKSDSQRHSQRHKKRTEYRKDKRKRLRMARRKRHRENEFMSSVSEIEKFERLEDHRESLAQRFDSGPSVSGTAMLVYGKDTLHSLKSLSPSVVMMPSDEQSFNKNQLAILAKETGVEEKRIQSNFQAQANEQNRVYFKPGKEIKLGAYSKLISVRINELSAGHLYRFWVSTIMSEGFDITKATEISSLWEKDIMSNEWEEMDEDSDIYNEQVEDINYDNSSHKDFNKLVPHAWIHHSDVIVGSNVDISEANSVQTSTQMTHKPSETRPPRLRASTATTVSLSWAYPLDDGGLPLTAFVIERSMIRKNDVAPSSFGFGVTYPADTRSATVPHLVPGRQYRFRVAAVNDRGVGVYSKPSRVISTRQPKPGDIIDMTGIEMLRNAEKDKKKRDEEVAQSGVSSNVSDQPKEADKEEKVSNFDLSELTSVQTPCYGPYTTMLVKEQQISINTHKTNTSFTLDVWIGHHSPRKFDVRSEIVRAIPMDASKNFINSDALRDRIAILERGKVPLHTLVLRAMEAGAVGAIIIDDKKDRCNTKFDQKCVIGSSKYQNEGFAAGDKADTWSELDIPAVLTKRSDSKRLLDLLK